MKPTERVAFRLIRADLQFLLTIVRNAAVSGPGYLVASLPYVGMIIDGCETWSQKIKSLQGRVPSFTEEEKQFFQELRSKIKLWETPFVDLLNQKYDESEMHFSDVCKPIAKRLKLYDIYGTYLIDGFFCDNTILDALFVPGFHLKQMDGSYLEAMGRVGGKMIARFGIMEKDILPIATSTKFETKDFGGFSKSPVGNEFSDKFALFSILCATNFILYGIDKYIAAETPTKLRLAYIQYYYLAQQLPQINSIFKVHFDMDTQWVDDQFRNCMAHYGLGNVLPQPDVIETDLFGGLTERLFQKDWITVKDSILSELLKLSTQFTAFLKL